MTSRAQRAAALQALAGSGEPLPPAAQFRRLAADPAFGDVPLPGSGRTLERWQLWCDLAALDLSVLKLFEAHADAMAILRELKHETLIGPGAAWGVWAAESAHARVIASEWLDGRVRLDGQKQWCSGARSLTHALITTWRADGSGPWLVSVALGQPGVSIDGSAWQAVGMADSESADLRFDGALGEPVGAPGDYVARPGFMHGGAGIAACWYGGALVLARALHRAVAGATDRAGVPFRVAGLGKVDMALGQTAALLRETAAWIDRWPHADATLPALRVRQSAEACARTVLDEVGRALGATPFCRDRRFARMAADLAVFTRQSLAERDFHALGERLCGEAEPHWRLEESA